MRHLFFLLLFIPNLILAQCAGIPSFTLNPAPVNGNYEPGTVLIFGGSHEVTISTLSHDISVAGVVSTNPAHLMNSALKGNNVIPLALQGRVPCQVRGPVKKGTLLVTSNIAGVAEACKDTLYKPGCVIGKSLAEILDNSIQLIEIVVGRV